MEIIRGRNLVRAAISAACFAAAALTAAVASAAPAARTASLGILSKTSPAIYRVPEWYRDAKFGIFIHWGLYSVPAYGSEWYPREMYQKGSKTFEHHIATYGSQATFGYKDFIPQFKAEKFNPSDWIALFREAGASARV